MSLLPGQLRFLLLEDTRLDAALAIEQLRLAGFDAEFVVVHSREEFLHKLKQERFDLILADYHLPSFEGLQAIDLARNINPGVPFVFVTSTTGDDIAVEASRPGVTGYILKTRMSMLGQAAERALRELNLARERQSANQEVARAAELMKEHEKLVSIGRLVATIVHEINNPLEAVSNLIYLLNSNQSLDPAAREYVEMARREIGRVVQITRQTLNFYREASEPVDVGPAELLDEVFGLYARKLETKGINICRDYRYGGTICVLPGELRQVFSNVIGNAIDAMPSGGNITVRMRASRQWSDEGVTGIRIVIADDGTGMTRDTLARIGHAFYTSKGQKGTGLGLWVTKNIVTKYGGVLTVRSSTNGVRHGSVFSIFLPGTMASVTLPGTRGATSDPTLDKEAARS